MVYVVLFANEITSAQNDRNKPNPHKLCFSPNQDPNHVFLDYNAKLNLLNTYIAHIDP